MVNRIVSIARQASLFQYLRFLLSFKDRHIQINLRVAGLLIMLAAVLEILVFVSFALFWTTLFNNNITSGAPGVFGHFASLVSSGNNIYAYGLVTAGIVVISGIYRHAVIGFFSYLAGLVVGKASVSIIESNLDRKYVRSGRTSYTSLIVASIPCSREVHLALISIGEFLISIIVSLVLLIAIVYVNPISSMSILIPIVFSYCFFTFPVRSKVNRFAQNAVRTQDRQSSFIQYLFQDIRNILLEERRDICLKGFKRRDELLRRQDHLRYFYGSFPRSAMDSILAAILVCWILILLASNNGSIALLLEFLGISFFGIQRLIPSAQKVFSNWIGFKGAYPDLLNMLKYLDTLEFVNSFEYKPVSRHSGCQKNTEVQSFKSLEVVDLTIGHASGKALICNASFEIVRGSFVALLGKSGVGKSSLLDVLVGLAEPISGEVFVNGEPLYNSGSDRNILEWQRMLSYVPQKSILPNRTLYSNLTSSKPGIPVEVNSLKCLFEYADLNQDDFFESNLHRLVGHSGSSVSGGQLQRVSLARALYRDPEFLVLDECTSNLDRTSKEKIYLTLRSLAAKRSKTILLITHDNINYDDFDSVLRIDNKSIIKQK